MLRSSFYMNGKLERGHDWRILFPSIVDHGVQFQCQLHACALMRISGSCVSILEGCCAFFDDCLVVWRGTFQDE